MMIGKSAKVSYFLTFIFQTGYSSKRNLQKLHFTIQGQIANVTSFVSAKKCTTHDF